jgi:hypothetical protein
MGQLSGGGTQARGGEHDGGSETHDRLAVVSG